MRRTNYFVLGLLLFLVGCGDSNNGSNDAGSAGGGAGGGVGGGAGGGSGGGAGGGAGGGVGGGAGGGGGAAVCTPGSTVSCYSGAPATEGVGVCHGGQKTCLSDGSDYGPCTNEVLPSTEDCATAADDDCDGTANQAAAGCVCDPASTASCYTGAQGTEGVGVCVAGTKTCAADGKSYGACTGEVTPTSENCSTSTDENCDGQVNESCGCTPSSTQSCYTGTVGTMGVGVCHAGTQTCNSSGTGFGTCTGQVTPSTEICGNSADDNCDGQVDEGCICTPNANVSCYSGDPATLNMGVCHAGSKTCAADGKSFGPCVGEVTPTAEVCGNNADENCDGTTAGACVTWTNDASPIYQAHCASCHTTLRSGGANFATSYADSQQQSFVCPGLTVGACTLVRIHNGSMPQGAGCTGDPAQDAQNAACLTASEQATIQAWIDDGQRQ